MGPVVTNMASFHWSTVRTDESGNCTGVIQLPETLALSRILLIAADLMVVVLTWAPTYEVAKIARAEFGTKRTTLAFVMLRDGLIFFGIMVTLNVLHLILTACSVLMGADHTSEITQITETLTTILVSRLMLNLQETSYRQGATKSEYESALACGRSISSLHFEQMVGSFGMSPCPNACEGEGDPNDNLKEHSEPTHDHDHEPV
ncbi:hypothetical protein GSI_07594 [Ganoderma sinense ZZ0214-1]|uniref:Uncharacterized protein n=1 Tax=Ganoderma sinense ZZ0214-1 TaxID=1077348 RepID=A0A2G8S9Z7_9APHY|nr:hypothetical protein GSI_07594 [Ganoderma sinense ZZ0214-1]